MTSQTNYVANPLIYAPLSLCAVFTFVLIGFLPQTLEVLLHVIASGPPDPTYYILPIASLTTFVVLLFFGFADARIHPEDIDKVRTAFKFGAVMVIALMLGCVAIVRYVTHTLATTSYYTTGTNVVTPAVLIITVLICYGALFGIMPAIILSFPALYRRLGHWFRRGYVLLRTIVLITTAGLVGIALAGPTFTAETTRYLAISGLSLATATMFQTILGSGERFRPTVYYAQNILRGLISCLLCIVFGLALAFSNTTTEFIYRAGPIGLTCAFASLVLLCLRMTGSIIRHRWWSTAPVVGFVILVMATHWYGYNDIFFLRGAHETTKRYSPQICGPECLDHYVVAEDPYEKWLSDRREAFEFLREKGKRYPIFVFAFQGGGLYAAYHAAATTAALMDACPKLRKHIFAFSGVSGGSIGGAVLASLIHGQKFPDVEHCDASGSSVSSYDIRLLPRVKAIFERDLLSPVLATGLFLDVPRSLLPYPLSSALSDWSYITGQDRAIAFEDAIVRRVGALPSSDAFDPKESVAFLRSDIFLQFRDRSSSPYLIFGGTMVENGRQFVMGPRHLSAEHSLSAADEFDFAEASFQIIGAASLSSRFPLIMPPGSVWGVRRSDSKMQKLHVVDGGYLDNSAVLQIENVVKRLRNEIARGQYNATVEPIYFTWGPSPIDLETSSFIEFVSPIRVMNYVRRVASSERLKNAFAEDVRRNGPGCRAYFIGRAEGALPLAWILSDQSHTFIDYQSGVERDLGGDWKLGVMPEDIRGQTYLGCATDDFEGARMRLSNRHLNFRILSAVSGGI